MANQGTLPFSISKEENFFDRLGDYIGDIFYDILPEKGYELRDEQIYMAFQIEQAFKNKSTIFAEAGVGTGKTFVYLLYAICYARYRGKPAIISCADETLIEQLVKRGGDIEKLEEALDLDIDVRLAKAREQYICVRKLNELIEFTEDPDITMVHDQIPEFVFDNSASMKSFHRYGDRKEYPWVSNEKWEAIAWDPLQQCSTCEWRHRSGQTLNRDYYRHSKDLIICSHDFYMEHVWTKESRKREGQLPLLPEASCVVFDEGHLLEFAAQKGLTHRFQEANLTNVLTNYSSQNVREESLLLIEDILDLHQDWFDLLSESAEEIEGSNRKNVPITEEVSAAARKLHKLVDKLLEQLVFDAELFTIDDYDLKIMEEYLEFFGYGLSILLNKDEGIFWLEENEDQLSFVIMPRLVEDILKKEVFSQKIPFVFSSATLSQAGDFSYLAKSLGIESYLDFTVDSPFDYENQMKLAGRQTETELTKWAGIEASIKQMEGRTLVLFSSKEEMERFRKYIELDLPAQEILFEGDQEISQLVRKFQFDESVVLCSYNLWEGLDIPGPSLSQVIISSLPFPPHDPVFEAKRKHSSNPDEEIDLPFMLLRIRQGVGRLIRTTTDKGRVEIWMQKEERDKFGEIISGVLPLKMDWQK